MMENEASHPCIQPKASVKTSLQAPRRPEMGALGFEEGTRRWHGRCIPALVHRCGLRCPSMEYSEASKYGASHFIDYPGTSTPRRLHIGED